ncbi:MAG: sulfurtransferase [Pseudomonas sp. 34-62-33]|jgi:rhodanese-related sulfurtransferase|nr:MAG: sulfurtransferase [Pseudomonas sp. 34-62-33]
MKSAHDLVLATKTRITEVDLSQAEAAIRDADLLIDVREADEYNAAHIPGAINIPRGLLEFKLSNDAQLAERTLKLVLYCKNSGRSALAADALREMGYRNVLSLAGGIEAWQAAGRELLTPTLPAFD